MIGRSIRFVAPPLLVLALLLSSAATASGAGYGPWAGKYTGGGKSASDSNLPFKVKLRLTKKGKVKGLTVSRLNVYCDFVYYGFHKTAFTKKIRLDKKLGFKVKQSFPSGFGDDYVMQVRGELTHLGAKFKGLVAVKPPSSNSNCGPHSRWTAR